MAETLNRQEVVSLLSKAAPALSTKDVVPILMCFCFQEGLVTAYDDVVAIQVPSSIPLVGGIHGQVLLDFLGASLARDLTITPIEGGNIRFKAANAKLDLPMVPAENFVFDVPDRAGALAFPLDKTIIQCFEHCLPTMGMDPAHAWGLGVTISFRENMIVFYSNNNFSATRVVLAVEAGIPEQFVEKVIVVPPRFCELLTESKTPAREIYFSDLWLEVEFEDGTRLFSRTVDQSAVDRYDAVFAKADEAFDSAGGLPVPKLLEKTLNRAMVVLGRSPDKRTEFTIDGQYIRTFSKSTLGETSDIVPDFAGHPPVKLSSHPDLILKCLPKMTHIAFSPASVVLVGGPITRLVRAFA